MNWNELRKETHGSPRFSPGHFGQTIRRIYDRGANLATPEMVALWDPISWDELQNGTYKQPLYVEDFHWHERSGPIEMVIDNEIAEWIKEQGEVWLMPVEDDEEYVSWDFYFVVGTEAEVLNKLKA